MPLLTPTSFHRFLTPGITRARNLIVPPQIAASGTIIRNIFYGTPLQGPTPPPRIWSPWI